MAANNIDESSFPKKAAPPLTVDARKQMGRERKLWRLEIYFEEITKNELCRYFMDNKTGSEVLEFREKIFSIGVMVQTEPGQWVIVPPANIKQVNVWRQDKFFDVL